MQKLLFLLLSTIFTFNLLAQSDAEIQIQLDKTALDLVQRKTYLQVLQRLENKLLTKVGANANLVQLIYEQPLTVGIDTSNHLVAFIDILEGFSHMGVQIPLANAALFELQIKQYASNNLRNIKPIDQSIVNAQIKATLEAQREERIARRKTLFDIHELAATGTRFIQQNEFILAWTNTHAFLIKSSPDNNLEQVENHEGGVEDYYQSIEQELVMVQRDYISHLQVIPSQPFQNDIFIQLSAEGSTKFNEANQSLGQRAPLLLLFDQNVVLENTPHQISIDFEQEQIAIQLTQSDNLKIIKNWSKAELIEDWSDIELVEEEDSLDVWFRVVLGQRVK